MGLWKGSSPSSRAEWVEIHEYFAENNCKESPSSRAEWVEIKLIIAKHKEVISLRPRGRSGLKFSIQCLSQDIRSVSVLAGGVG